MKLTYWLSKLLVSLFVFLFSLVGFTLYLAIVAPLIIREGTTLELISGVVFAIIYAIFLFQKFIYSVKCVQFFIEMETRTTSFSDIHKDVKKDL